MREMLERLLPDDDGEVESEEKQEIRRRWNDEAEGGDVVEVSEAEVGWAIRRMRSKRAPGIDGIRVELVKRLIDCLSAVLVKLVNKMLVIGYFPEVWKVGVVKVFLKDERKPPEEVKSYRPVTLLPVLGKVVERLLVVRLKRFLAEGGWLHEGQYGFVEGKSTVKALADVAEEVRERDDKVVLGVFADISGAFDNAWWPWILHQLRVWGCPKNLFRVLRSYLSERKAVMRLGGYEAEKMLSKGCPQGSILGPYLWNVLFDGFLRKDYGQGARAFAYADDGLVVVSGDTRRAVEERASWAAAGLWDWADTVKLTVSAEKTVAMLLKWDRFNVGKAWKRKDYGRKFVVRCRGRRLMSVSSVKYLGLHTGERWCFERHVVETAGKVLGEFGKLKRIAKANSGLGVPTMVRLYNGYG